MASSICAGTISEMGDEYIFQYDEEYLKDENNLPVSLTMPKSLKTFKSKTLFPFFDGLIPEGWLLDIVEKNWKLDQKDRMGLLLAVCGDCIGNVHIERMEE